VTLGRVVLVVVIAGSLGSCSKQKAETASALDRDAGADDDLAALEHELAQQKSVLVARGLAFAEPPDDAAAAAPPTDGGDAPTGETQAKIETPSAKDGAAANRAAEPAKPRSIAKKKKRRVVAGKGEASTDACAPICGPAEAICGLAERICTLAEEHDDDERYASACARAEDDCDRAADACEACRD
jgi:hypothetical protein